MKIIFVNSSPNAAGNTAALAKILLKNTAYETLMLTDYKIYAYGQSFKDDEFDKVLQRLKDAETIVIGSPLYWHNLNGMLRNFMDRCYGNPMADVLKGKSLYFIIQGAAPETWQIEACEYTMKRFCAYYSMVYKGKITNSSDAQKLQLN